MDRGEGVHPCRGVPSGKDGPTSWAGCMAEALQCYTAAVETAERASERAIVAESLRRSAHRASPPEPTGFGPADVRAEPQDRRGSGRPGAGGRGLERARRVRSGERLDALGQGKVPGGPASSADRARICGAAPSRTSASWPTSRATPEEAIGALPPVAPLLREHRRTTAAAPLPITTWGW